jgi:hypothetical protein
MASLYPGDGMVLPRSQLLIVDSLTPILSPASFWVRPSFCRCLRRRPPIVCEGCSPPLPVL